MRAKPLCTLLLAFALAVPATASATEEAFQPRQDFGAPLEVPGKVIHGVGQSHLSEYASLATRLPDDRQPAFTMVYLGLRSPAERIEQRFDSWETWLEGMPEDAGLQLGLTFSRRGARLSQRRAFWRSIPDGEWDATLNRIAERIRQLDRPVWVRIGFECNGFWNGYEPESYIPAFRHIAEVLREGGGDKLATAWCVHPIDGMDRLMQFHPGDAWVDWWSIDLFQPRFMNRDVVRAFCRRAAKHGRPVLIGEATPSEVPRDEQWERWHKPFFELIRSEPAIKGFSFINRNWNATRWDWGDARVHTDPELLRRYTAEMGLPLYHHAQRLGPNALRVAPARVDGPTDDAGRFVLRSGETRRIRLPRAAQGAGVRSAWLVLAYRLLDEDRKPVDAGEATLRLIVRDPESGSILASSTCRARERDEKIEMALAGPWRAVEGPLELVVRAGDPDKPEAFALALHGPETEAGVEPQLTWIVERTPATVGPAIEPSTPADRQSPARPRSRRPARPGTVDP